MVHHSAKSESVASTESVSASAESFKDSHNISLVSGMYKLKYSLLLDDINLQQSVFSICHYFTEALKEIHYVKGTVFISQDLLQTSVISSGLWLIREDFKGTVFI